jgi:hypothetical protein
MGGLAFFPGLCLLWYWSLLLIRQPVASLSLIQH